MEQAYIPNKFYISGQLVHTGARKLEVQRQETRSDNRVATVRQLGTTYKPREGLDMDADTSRSSRSTKENCDKYYKAKTAGGRSRSSQHDSKDGPANNAPSIMSTTISTFPTVSTSPSSPNHEALGSTRTTTSRKDASSSSTSGTTTSKHDTSKHGTSSSSGRHYIARWILQRHLRAGQLGRVDPEYDRGRKRGKKNAKGHTSMHNIGKRQEFSSQSRRQVQVQKTSRPRSSYKQIPKQGTEAIPEHYD